MPTLMSRRTFDGLVQARETIIRNLPDAERPTHVFVPWAGPTLVASGRGIYIVGIALTAQGLYCENTFDDCLDATERFVAGNKGTRGSFWLWVNSLTSELLGAGAWETRDRWGWSNLLKIAGASGKPEKWPTELKSHQSIACAAALREELSLLRNSLIVIASNDLYGAFPKELRDVSWDRSREHDSGTWSFYDQSCGNALLNCYHPRFVRGGLPKIAAGVIVDFARQNLSPF